MLPLLSDINGVTDPVFINSLIILLGIILSILKNFSNGAKLDETKKKVATIHENTNSTLAELHKTIAQLAATQATPEELVARQKNTPPTHET